jgi:hypothetical protein
MLKIRTLRLHKAIHGTETKTKVCSLKQIITTWPL